MKRAWPGRPREMTSTGRRGRHCSEVVVDETARPPETKFCSGLGRVCEGTTTWWSPARALMSWQRAVVGDPGQDDLGAEEGEEPLGRLPPAHPGLGEVLQAGEGDQPLSAAFGGQRGQRGERGDVGHLVEGEDHRGGVGRPGEHGGPDLLEQGDDQGGQLVLLLGRGADVEGVRRAAKATGSKLGCLADSSTASER